MDKPTANAQLLDSAVLSGISLQRVGKKICGDVIGDLVQLRDDLIGKLHSPAIVSDWQKKRDADLLRFAQGTIDKSYGQIAKKSADALDGLGAVEVHKLSTTVNAVVGVNLSAAMSDNLLAAISQTGKLLVQGAVQKSYWERQSDDLKHGFSSQVKMSMLQGKPIATMVKTTKDLLDVKSSQATAIVRTSVATTQGIAQKKYFDANLNIIKGIQLCATLDSRTSAICRANDHLAWSYPGLEPIGHDKKFPGWIPLHWNCRSTFLPILRSWSELANVKVKSQDNAKVDEIFRQKLRDKGWSEERIAKAQMNQRASVDGQVASSMTYEQWLKTKPVEFQQQVLGQQRWQLWHDGKASLDQMVDGNGQELSVEALHQSVKDNVAVPVAAKADGEAGLSLGERQILSAQRTAAVQENAYKSTWLDQESGLTADMSTTHTMSQHELNGLKDFKSLVHLSNSLTLGEYWADAEVRLWSNLPGFKGAKLVMPNGKVAIVKLKKGQQWSADKADEYQRALRSAQRMAEADKGVKQKSKYGSAEAQAAYAFRQTGVVTFATTSVGEVEADGKLFKMVYPPLEEKPAPFREPFAKERERAMAERDKKTAIERLREFDVATYAEAFAKDIDAAGLNMSLAERGGKKFQEGFMERIKVKNPVKAEDVLTKGWETRDHKTGAVGEVDDYVKKAISAKVQAFLDVLPRDLVRELPPLKVEIVSNAPYGGQYSSANGGEYGTLRINPDSWHGQGVTFHELGHWVHMDGPEGFRQLIDNLYRQTPGKMSTVHRDAKDGGDYQSKSGFIDEYAGRDYGWKWAGLELPTRNGSEYLAEEYASGLVVHLRNDDRRAQFANTLSVFYYKREKI